MIAIMTNPNSNRTLPRYQSHKIVEALKIKSMREVTDPGGKVMALDIEPEESGFGIFTVEAKFIPKHDPARPRVGWYWVRYENGYESFSPADAFESGYTRVG